MVTRRALRKRRLLGAVLVLALGLALAVWGLWWVGLLALGAGLWLASRRVGVPVMVYHSVSPDPSWLPWADNIAVRPEIFARHMAHLAASGWTVVSSQALFAAQRGEGDLPKRALVVQFDDAYADFWTHAVPVLLEHGHAATVFASSDFIDPALDLRGPRDPKGARGYMTAPELRAADAEPLIEVACHGKDHARLAVGPGGVPRVPAVWGKETAWLWSKIPGNKARWFDRPPPGLAQVPPSESSLCARAWTPEGQETASARDARVQADLGEARRVLSKVLGRDVTFLCWPFDRCDPEAFENARAAGFTQFTGGLADNRLGQGDAALSRTHVNDRAAGGGPDWVEVLVFRAKLEVASGNLLFWPIAAVAALLRKRRFAFLHGPGAAPEVLAEAPAP